MTALYGIGVRISTNVLETECSEYFKKSGCTSVAYILKITYADLEKWFISKPVKYVRRARRLFATDSFGSSVEKHNSLVLVSVRGKEGGGLWVAKVLLLFRINVTKRNENVTYSFLQYIEVKHRIYIVDDTLGFIHLWCSTNDELDHDLTEEANCLKQERGEWLNVESSQPIESFTNNIKVKLQ